MFPVLTKGYHVQVYLGNVVGSVLDHCNKASFTDGGFYLQCVKKCNISEA